MLRRSFAVWEKASASIEIDQGKAMADAAVAAGASLLIWSSLPNVTKMTKGKLSGVKHFDSKAEVESYIRGLPIKSVFYMPAFYMQNMTSLFKPKPVSPALLTSIRQREEATPRFDHINTAEPRRYSHIHCTLERRYSAPADRHHRHR